MKYYIKTVLVSTILVLFSCAVQSYPSGGAHDRESPYVKKIQPENGTVGINSKETVEITFNEMLDPKSVKSSIKIYPQIAVSISCYRNKILIKPKNEWPIDIPFYISLKRDISDYHGNELEFSYVLSYNVLTSMPKGKIVGKVFNNNDIKKSNIGLFNINDNDLNLICVTQNNYLNEFEFSYIPKGEYLIVVLDGLIDNIFEDIRKNNYSLNSRKIYVNDNFIDNAQLNFNYPAYRKKIKSSRFENKYYGIINMDDGSSVHLINSSIKSDSFIKKEDVIYYENSNDDSLDIIVDLRNNIEFYSVNKRIDFTYPKNDTIRPYIINNQTFDDGVHISFSEPIQIDKTKGKNPFLNMNSDSTFSSIDFSILNPLTILLKSIANNQSSSIIINDDLILDLSDNKNQLSDSLLFITPSVEIADKKIGGNIFGKIIYNGSNQIIVEAIDIKNGSKKSVYTDRSNNFKLWNVDVSTYQLWAYEDLNNVGDSYFNGTLEPLKFSAKFGYYNEIVDTRAKWDIENIIINIK